MIGGGLTLTGIGSVIGGPILAVSTTAVAAGTVATTGGFGMMHSSYNKGKENAAKINEVKKPEIDKGKLKKDARKLDEKIGKGNEGESKADVVEVEISRSKYPESTKHIEDAIANGQPEVLTIDRAGKKANRRASLKGIDKVPGKDLDEYPPAMFKEGGSGASVRPINPSDNRGSGASFGHKLRTYQDGTRIKFKITDD